MLDNILISEKFQNYFAIGSRCMKADGKSISKHLLQRALQGVEIGLVADGCVMAALHENRDAEDAACCLGLAALKAVYYTRNDHFAPMKKGT
ncbi:MAG: hypothetical protein Q4G28_07530 [Neisseria sp.]|nr:hypothetical protein [Neisseria sp.]